MKVRGFEFIGLYEKDDLSLPQRKTSYSAGYDLAAAEDTLIESHKVTLIPTGVKAYMQQDEYLGIHIRSSLAVKHQLSLINAQGIIDADYYNNESNEGHILIAVYNSSNTPFAVNKGDRIAQGIFYKYLLADDDTTAVNVCRTGGIGSTGK
jgi:dUTP pyrophosphatase